MTISSETAAADIEFRQIIVQRPLEGSSRKHVSSNAYRAAS
jgi:hypothetical protein